MTYCLNIFITFVRKNNIILMATIDIKDKTFETLIPEEEIMRRVKTVADRISNDLKGKKPLLLGVLNGSFILPPT